jgi:hypothetical protein
MAKSLEVKALTRIAGDKVHDTFEADSVIVMLFDAQTKSIQVFYEFDRNEGGYVENVEPFPLGTGLASKVIQTRLPLLLGSMEEQVANGAYFPVCWKEREGLLSQSGRSAIVTGDRSWVWSPWLIIARMFFQRITCDPATFRRIWAWRSNARLFQAEQQRAELAIINSVRPAAEPNSRNLRHGYDKLREIFRNSDLNIRIYDQRPTWDFPYVYENGGIIIDLILCPIKGSARSA